MTSKDYYYYKFNMTSLKAEGTFNTIHELTKKCATEEKITKKEIINALSELDGTLEELFNLVLALERKLSEKND